jgi:hypothetical protein
VRTVHAFICVHERVRDTHIIIILIEDGNDVDGACLVKARRKKNKKRRARATVGCKLATSYSSSG